MAPTATSFTKAPPASRLAILSFPTPHIFLVTLNRPEQLNCIGSAGHYELDRIWRWMDDEPTLRVGILAAKGRAWCAGADLKEWLDSAGPDGPQREAMPPTGFGGLSRRQGKKSVIAAVHGIAFGGGCEMIINCDLVIATKDAKFALPEVKVGVAAIAGALPRLPRIVGRQRAMEMALTGREVSAEEAKDWGLVNKVVGGGQDAVQTEAVKWAERIVANSPDSVRVSKEGIDMGAQMGVEEATQSIEKGTWRSVENGDNLREGIAAFVEKRKPRWRDSKL